jgi:hypothetical protein
MSDKDKFKRDWKTKSAAIRRILLTEWNPIGFDVPEDEYDSHIPDIYRLMRERAGIPAITAYLDQHDIGSTEPGRAETNQRVAKMLITLTE